MPRVTKSVTAKAKHKKVLSATKGHYGARSRLFKTAKQSNIKSLQYAFRDRKNRKRAFRSLWISRINAASRALGVSYSKLINGMTSNNIWVANDPPSKPKYANFTGPPGTMGGLPAFKNNVVTGRYNCPTTNTAKGPICNLAYSQSNNGGYRVGIWSTQQAPSMINWQALIGPSGLAKNETTYVNHKSIVDLDAYKKDYYKAHFKDHTVKTVCHAYMQGLQWVINYYKIGIPDWKWQYPYFYAPFLGDLATHSPTYKNTKFKKGEPVELFMQFIFKKLFSDILFILEQIFFTHRQSFEKCFHGVCIEINKILPLVCKMCPYRFINIYHNINPTL